MDPLPPHHENHPDVISRNASRGLVLFILYFGLYVVFLMINVFSPESMSKPAWGAGDQTHGGPTVAVVWGFALILAAAILALVYMGLTRAKKV